jgi:hypothetical protein
LDVTTNIDAATLSTTGLATLNNAVANMLQLMTDVTTNIDAATLSTSGLAT